MQVLPLASLRTDPLRSLLFLHSQPPLFNALVAGLQRLGGSAPLAAWLFVCACSLVSALGVYELTRELGLREHASAVVACLYLITPTSLLYEQWLFYSAPTAALLPWWGVHFVRAARRRSRSNLIAWAMTSVGLCWTWSAFHPFWMIVSGAYLFWVGGWRRSAPIVAAAIVAVAPMIKNEVLVDRFATSTWDGLGLARVVQVHAAPGALRSEDEGEQSVLDRGTFAHPSAYRRALFKCEGPPALCAAWKIPPKKGGVPNFNHKFYAYAGRVFRDAAVRAIVEDPGTYLAGVGQGAAKFWNPATDYSYVEGNGQRIERYVDAYDWLSGARGKREGVPWAKREVVYSRVTWVPLVLTVAGLGLLARRASRRHGRHRLVAAAMLLLPAAASCFVEYGENERFRATFEPVLFVIQVLAVATVGAWVHRTTREILRRPT